MEAKRICIGVLALQGAFIEHIHLLRKLQGVDAIEVRSPADLDKIDGLIIPGGESTVMALVGARNGIFDAIKQFVVDHKKPTFGTCAGAIILSKSADRQKEGGQELLEAIDMHVARNYFGSQISSFETDLDVSFKGMDGIGADKEATLRKFRGVFIRAPAILDAGPRVQVLATLDGSQNPVDHEHPSSVIVAVKQDNCMATSFHPELTNDTAFHEFFVNMVRQFASKKLP